MNDPHYPDDEDYQKEMAKPYRYHCPIHGDGYAALDECPKCMEEDAMKDEHHIPSSICWTCGSCESDPESTVQHGRTDCGYYGFPQVPRKKNCKGFTPETNDDLDALMDIDEREREFE